MDNLLLINTCLIIINQFLVMRIVFYIFNEVDATDSTKRSSQHLTMFKIKNTVDLDV